MAVGARRLVYLSSASVHGQAPASGTDESSALSARQTIPYNNSKVWAERKLWRLRRGRDVEVVILRPGIVFGPRSRWTGGLADELLSGQACFIGSGDGICNSVYIDNLVHAIHLAATVADVDGHAFLVGDRETVTWREFYRPVVEALGMDLAQVPSVSLPRRASLWRDPLEFVQSSEKVTLAVSSLPRPLRKGFHAAHHLWRQRRSNGRSPWENPLPPQPVAIPERALLNQCRYKLPFNKATALLGYEPIVSFNEGCRRSVAWLAFAGYPIIEDRQQYQRGGAQGCPPAGTTRTF